MTETSITTATHPVVDGARDLYIVMQVAELRGLPIPFAIRAWEHGGIELQFHSRDEVVTWAEVLDAELVDNFYEQVNPADHVAGVRAEWMDIQLVLVSTAPLKAVS